MDAPADVDGIFLHEFQPPHDLHHGRHGLKIVQGESVYQKTAGGGLV